MKSITEKSSLALLGGEKSVANPNKELFHWPIVTKEDEDAVISVLRAGSMSQTDISIQFENELSSWAKTKYALTFCNGTASLLGAMYGCGIGYGDEVIGPSYTYWASMMPVLSLGAVPVFADIDPISLTIDPFEIEKKITPKTKAVIVVDLYGNMPDMDELQAICDRHGIYLIEDAAESVGSKYNNTRAGKFGIGSVFSFHRTKTLTTGEGGMLLVDDEKLFQRCKFLRDHGRAPGTYFNTEVTFKYMPSNLLASLGYAQFLRLDELVEKKRWIWKSFQEHLSDVPDLHFNPEPEGVYNGVWCTALIFGKSHNITKQQVMDEMSQIGLPTRPFFYPLTLLPAFGAKIEEGRKNSPVAYDISDRGINLPCAFTVDENQIGIMSEGIKKILKKTRANAA